MTIKLRTFFSLVLAGGLLSTLSLPVSALTENEVAKLLANDGAADDQFGFVVDLDDDTAVIGAVQDDDGGSNSGSAYVFTRSAGVWTQQAKLTASDAAAFDSFGYGVAVSGDTVVVSAYQDDDNGSGSGSAYVFIRSAGVWTQQAKLTASDAAASDLFGISVDLDGDTAIVGAIFDDDNGSSSGSAYVFTRSAGVWTQQAKLIASDAAAGDWLGYWIAVDGDTALISAIRENSNTGSAYVFTRTAGVWTEQAKLTASDGATGDLFGQGLDLDGDTAIIGDPNSDGAGNQSGSAYVFTRVGTSWSEQQKLTASDAAAGDVFGFSVGIDGNTVLVGASTDDDNGSNSGSAYRFTSSAGVWTEQAKLIASDAVAGDRFGFRLSVDGGTAVVTSVLDDDNGSGSGSGYIFMVASEPTPIANAGPDQTADEGILVALNGSNSANATNYEWMQVAGPTVSLSDDMVAGPTFTAPYVGINTTLTFELIVEDDAGNFSDPDSVDITVVSVNNPPIADAGNDGTIKEGAQATLDGSNSFDPEGDTPLGFEWTQTSGTPVTLLPSNTVVGPNFTAPLGVGAQLVFDLVVDDGKEFSTPDEVTITVVENSPPVANAGSDQTVDEGALVNLNGTGSSDPDGGDTLSFDWTEPVALDDSTSPTPSFTTSAVGPGGTALTFDLVVTDDDPVNPKSSGPDSVTINVRNINDPPSCELARASCPDSKIKNNDGCTLWPPNHKMTAVTIEGVMDADSVYNTVTLEITGVSQDEPVNGGGDGDSSPDAVVQFGDPADSVLIRSERTGLGGAQENGRVYVVNFTADDGFESCTGSVTVGVPHDRKDTPIDDGQAYDSTQP